MIGRVRTYINEDNLKHKDTYTRERLEKINDFGNHLSDKLFRESFLNNPLKHLNNPQQPPHIPNSLIEFVRDNFYTMVNCDGELACIGGLCCNYIDKSIYINYVKCDYLEIREYLEELRDNRKRPKMLEYFFDIPSIKSRFQGRLPYNQTVEKYYIYKDGQIVNDILYLVDINTPIPTYTAHKITQSIITKLDDSLKINDAEELWNLFLPQCYGYSFEENGYNMYDGGILPKGIIKYLNSQGIRYNYKLSIEDYTDTRKYSLIKLRDEYTPKELGLDLPYNYKKFIFEYRVFVNMLNKNYFGGWTKGDLLNVANPEHNDFFCKYVKNGIAVVVKNTWVWNR